MALVAIGFAATRAGAEGSDPDAFRALDVGDGRVTFDVVDAPFGDVVRERIQAATRVNVVVSPEASAQRVTLRIIDLHWVQALDALAEQIGGILVRKANNLLRVERPKPVTYDFDGEDVRTVIMLIARYAGANVMISDEVKGTITLNLRETPWRESLEQIVRTVGYALVEENYGILRVVPVDALDLEQGYYRFRYLRPPAPYRGVIANQNRGAGGGGGGAGGAGGGTSGGQMGADVVRSDVWIPTDDPKEVEKNFPIIQSLRSIVAREAGDVTYNPGMNAIVYTGTKPKIQALRQLVEQLDVEPPQVFIDMNFIVTSNSDALDIGLANAGANGLGFSLSGADILHGLPFDFGGSTSDGASTITGTGFPSPNSGAFGFGTLNFSQTALLYQFLQRDQSATIVQAPKLLALDNEEATIFIGDSVRYARTTAATNQNGGLTFGIEEDENSPVNVGFQLLVIPHVIPGDNKIMMLVIPQRRDLTGTSSPVPGFERISAGGQSIDLPRVQSTTLKTTLILRSGETAVIGGLLRDQHRERVDKIPLLGDIPIIGLAFQGRSKSCTKEHLLITITPRILKGSDAVSCAIDDELSGSKRVESEWRDIYGRTMSTYPDPQCAPMRPVVGPPAGAAPVAAPAPTPVPVAPGR